jgi:hypothetical protein
MSGERLSSLPVPLTRLIGREQDLAAVCALVQQTDGRLVTLSGAGGSAKTSLALEVARSLRGSPPPPFAPARCPRPG